MKIWLLALVAIGIPACAQLGGSDLPRVGDSPAVDAAPGTIATHVWSLSGDRNLRPQSIRDDGRKTYLVWSEDQALPAVFALGPGGMEEMVDGYVRAGVFTIDRVYERLTFRIDRRIARAVRMARKAPGRG